MTKENTIKLFENKKVRSLWDSIVNVIEMITCIALFFTYNSMSGQDKIITVNNDTIECRILSITSTHINYEQVNGEYIVGKFIPVPEVLEYFKSAPKQNMLDTSRPFETQYVRPNYLPVKRWQAEIRFGGSYLTASTSAAEYSLTNIGITQADAKEYYKNIKTGVHFGANIYRMFDIFNESVNMGIGFKYRLSHFSAGINAALPNYYTPYTYFQLVQTEKVYVNYLGISYTTQQWLNNSRKFKLAYNVSGGYVLYRDESRFDESSIAINNELITGRTFGADVEIAFAYYPLDFLSLNANIDFFAAKLRYLTAHANGTVQTVELDKSNYENISHLNYSIGVQFHF
jgi:hypothetical protein